MGQILEPELIAWRGIKPWPGRWPRDLPIRHIEWQFVKFHRSRFAKNSNLPTTRNGKFHRASAETGHRTRRFTSRKFHRICRNYPVNSSRTMLKISRLHFLNIFRFAEESQIAVIRLFPLFSIQMSIQWSHHRRDYFTNFILNRSFTQTLDGFIEQNRCWSNYCSGWSHYTRSINGRDEDSTPFSNW